MTEQISDIDRDVFQHEIIAAAEEMSAVLRRSAFSPIIWDMIDYACGILDPQGNMVAQAPTIPAQLGIMPMAFRETVKSIPLTDWREGDVVVCNDPYAGCTHTPDIVMFAPVFAAGRLVAIAASIAHHIDVGGRVPGTEGDRSGQAQRHLLQDLCPERARSGSLDGRPRRADGGLQCRRESRGAAGRQIRACGFRYALRRDRRLCRDRAHPRAAGL
jgi:hypothetical protein